SNLSVYKKVRIVLGNGTCDLDSAVSALAQGYSEYLGKKKNAETDMAVIPLMNIFEREYRVKTEVIYFLNHHNIPTSLLTFRDQIDLKGLKDEGVVTLETILVDHHSLPDEDAFLTDTVIEVIDHRPRDANWPWLKSKVHIETVGSCATLVARNILSKHPDVVDPVLASPILIDTCNFSKEADRATSTDVQVVEQLETIGRLSIARNVTFDEIIRAKTDISELTPDDLLIRDLKVAAGVPIVGLPILVKNFVELENVFEVLRKFAVSRDTTIVVLLGMQVITEKLSRDVGIFSLTTDELKTKMMEALTLSAESSLDLTLTTEIEDKSGGDASLSLYTQGNLRATRKQILPIVRNTMTSQCRC
ncbi:Protein prune like protein, partial [Dufourea novaeangliae]